MQARFRYVRQTASKPSTSPTRAREDAARVSRHRSRADPRSLSTPSHCRRIAGIIRLTIRLPLLPQVLIKMRVALLAIALMGLVLGANAGAVDLTSSNFDAEVFESGKAAFVKFLAPWCVPHRRTPAAPPRDLRRARSARAAGARRDDRSTRRARFPALPRWIDRPVAPATRYRRGHRPARHGTPPTVDPPPGARSPNVASSFFFEPRKSIDRESLADRPVPLPLPLDTGEATASR